MNRQLKSLNSLLVLFGLDLGKTVRSLRGLRYYFRDLQAFRQQQAASEPAFPGWRHYPCLEERFLSSGSVGGAYFHQDLLVARRVFLNQPVTHVDVGSRIDGLVAHIAVFRAIDVLDIRPQSCQVTNVRFLQADLMQDLRAELVDRCDSLSSLHAVEHFGLGRYGDPINVDGHLAGLENLRRMLRQGGKFYFSVPIGQQRIEFNAHRVFSVGYLLDLFSGKYQLDHFSFVDDSGDLHENVPFDIADVKNSFGCRFGCGIFEMTKL